MYAVQTLKPLEANLQFVILSYINKIDKGSRRGVGG